MCKKSTSFDQCTPKYIYLYGFMLVIFGYKCLNHYNIIWIVTHKGHTPNFVCEEGGHYMLIFHTMCHYVCQIGYCLGEYYVKELYFFSPYNYLTFWYAHI